MEVKTEQSTEINTPLEFYHFIRLQEMNNDKILQEGRPGPEIFSLLHRLTEVLKYKVRDSQFPSNLARTLSMSDCYQHVDC